MEPEIGRALGSVVGKRVSLQMFPNSFHRIELGGVGREGFRADPACPVEESANENGPVNVQAIPEKDDRASKVFLKFPEKGDQVLGRHVLVRQESEVKSHAPPTRRDRDRPDRRDLLVGARAPVEDGRLSDRSPRASEMGSHQKPALVQENEARSQTRGVFYVLGHSSFTQRWISASSRSRARRSGFWGLKPRAWRRRAT